jgi:diguanylate cyclase (GGDEF)-like protein
VRARRTTWVAVAVLVVLVGVTGSVLGARAMAHGATQQSRQSTVTSSVEIASILQLAIQREEDLAVSTGTFLIGNPDVTMPQFAAWVATDRIFERFPEIQGLGEVVIVPAAQLPAFTARSEADPAGTLGAGGSFQVTPSGSRPYYCFESVSQSRSGLLNTPAGLDLCDTALGPALLASRDSGQGAYAPYGSGAATQLVIGTPVYSDGTASTTVQGRRAAFLGWTGTQIDPGLVLRAALQNHPTTAVVLHYHQGASTATIGAGKVPAHAQSTTIDLHNGWKVEVLTVPVAEGVLADPAALAILLSGIAIILLLATLVFVLGTGRSRALLLVDERTDQLRHQALHDALTGLPNRALILDRIGQMLAQSRRRATPVAVLFIDLDNFKDINDTLGHRAGDELLVAVAARLEIAVREGDTVGRLGGDEFVVLTEGSTPDTDAAMVAARILDVLSSPLTLAASDVPLVVSASIGFAEGDRGSPEELLQDADIALYEAKARGKHCAVRFSTSMQDAVDHHHHLEVDLHHALEDGQFFVVYQPMFDLSTGAFTGVESLLRWRHPERGEVQPDEFLASLESTALIVPVGAWVLHEVTRQGASWARHGHRLDVSVNVSMRQLEQDRLVDDVQDALAMSGLEPRRLVLEFTETALSDDTVATVARLEALKALGVRIAVDDFGTGYSSLAHLRQFPIDILKFDRSFLTGVTDSAETSALIHTVVQLGRVLGIDTVAQGVETADQIAYLRADHVDGAQGFPFARPMGVGDMTKFLQRGGIPFGTDEPGGPRDGSGHIIGTSTTG